VKLFESAFSGNCYKVRLLLHHLDLPYERVNVRLRMTPEEARAYREAHPLGRVPVLVLDDGQELAESNAMLCFLAEGTPYLPADRLERARVLQWMFWEQYEHEPTVAVVRAWVRYFGVPAGKEQELEERRGKARAAFDVMERHLAEHAFFVGDRYTVADICLYAYTHVADEGGLSLEGHPHVRAWLERVRAQPRHIPITA
jgi:glutathione S-transferase